MTMLPSTQLKINNHAIRHQSLSHPDLSPLWRCFSHLRAVSLASGALSLLRAVSLPSGPVSLSSAPSLSLLRRKLSNTSSLITHGFDVSNFFPQVVKNVATQSLEVKRLVYLYLLHYAQKRPNEALLLINCFQKDLGNPNTLVRAWALLAMARIRLHVIAPLVVVAVGKCSRDPSVYVRKCAANALTKLMICALMSILPVLKRSDSFLCSIVADLWEMETVVHICLIDLIWW